jgi:hypothetical protein
MKKLLLICLTLFLFQCEKDNLKSIQNVNIVEDELTKNSRLQVNKDSDAFLELGEKIINPYSIPNMEKALQSMKDKKKDIKDFKIKENYLYVRILPENEEEFNIVNTDKEIDLYEYPLDYKIKKQGNKYKDPTLKNSNYTWLYCAVPITKVFDKRLKLEVLEKLFLPFGNGKDDEFGINLKNSQKNNQAFLSALEDESLTLTGNNSSVTQKNGKVSYWQPEGIIKVWDERLSYNFYTNTYIKGAAGGFVPVPQCLVRANRLFSTYTELTDESGRYKFAHSFSNGSLNFSIKWERADFDIRSGTFGQAYYNGPSSAVGWNLDIQEVGTPDNYIYAHVHRAAWFYYYKNTFGILSPPNANFTGLGGKIHLGAKSGGSRSHYFAFNSTWLASDVKLNFNLTDDDARAILGTTIHELAHAVHWSIGMSYSAYCSNAGQAGRLAESWAQAVGWHVTRQIYGIQLNPWEDFDSMQLTSLNTFAGQSANCASNSAWYTPLFIDLMDNYNQVILLSNRPNDTVSGYTITELQNFLFAHPTNWYMYRDVLQNNSANPTETAAVQLFSDYD